MEQTNQNRTLYARAMAHPARPILVVAGILAIITGFAALHLVNNSQTSRPGGSGAGPCTIRAAAISYIVKMTKPAVASRLPDVYITARQSGWVKDVLVSAGQMVGIGQVIATIQPIRQTSSDAQDAYQSALEELDNAKSALNEARAAVETRKAEIAAQSARVNEAGNQLKAAQANLAQARSDLSQANQDLQQQNNALQQARSLFQDGAITQSDVQRAQAAQTAASNRQRQASTAFTDSENAARSASQNLANARQGLARANTGSDQARRAVLDAQDNLQARQSALAQAQSAIRAASANQPAVPITSPVNGVITSVSAQPGVLATQNMGIARIRSQGSAQVEFDVADSDAARLMVGMPASIMLTKNQPTLGGRIQAISPTNTGGGAPNRVTILAIDPQNRLKPGTSVTVQIPLQQISATAVPRTAITGSGSNTIVRTTANGSVIKKQVTIVGYEGDLAIISSGLVPGEQVQIPSGPYCPGR